MPAKPDGVDRLLIDEAAAYGDRPTVVLDDETGGLSLGLPDVVGTWCDSLLDRRTVLEQARAAAVELRVADWLEPELFADAGLVVARLPKGLAALDELAEAVAAYAPPGVTLLAAGRVRHMSRGMNEVLARHFGAVRGTLGRHKARGLIAEAPRPAPPSYPRSERHDDLDLVVCAHGAAFAGTAVDLGTRFLLDAVDRLPSDARQVVDLGCGSGVLAVAAARTLPAATVLALDVTASAIRSTTATAAANGLADRVLARQADGLEGVALGSLDLVLCNPPFHRGTALDVGTAPDLFAQVGARLRPGGELWVVWNSHLPYLPILRARVGSTRVVAQNPRFTVTRSVRPG
jgi:16S rRNA (guanine1207-N2)-methyltransferase